MTMSAPPPRQIDSWRAAEDNAAAWMRWWGYKDAQVTPGGPDAGIDVQSTEALAQVKWEAAQTGTPALQRLVGARRSDHHKTLLFFSGAGYSTPAIDYADDMDIALFKYALNGQVTPMSLAAHRVLLRHEHRTATHPRHLKPDPYRPNPHTPRATPSTPGKTGRPWLGRNWTALAGGFFSIQALQNGTEVIVGNAPSYIDWYDPLLSLLLAVVFIAIWVGTRSKRAEWKRQRSASSLP